MRAAILLALCMVAVSAAYEFDNRIVGGTVTTISHYPEITALLYSATGSNFRQMCGGTIVTTRSVLTAAHCFNAPMDVVARWRFRVGSTYANSGGVVHNSISIIRHPNYNQQTIDSDVAILRSASRIDYVNSVVRPANIAGPNYILGDNQVVWAAGWGVTEFGSASEQLRHVQIWTVNQATCRTRYAAVGNTITDNMLCSGWLDVGGRDQCQGDSGGPLYRNHVVVGICSWGRGCAQDRYPGVNVRVSRFTSWIQANA